MQNLESPTRDVSSLLALTSLPGIGKQTAAKAAANYATLRDLMAAGSTGPSRDFSPRVTASLRSESAWRDAWRHADRELEQAHDLGVVIISRFDDRYPKLLRRIPDPPLLVYLKGILRPDVRCVACVGTREPSVFGTTVASRITEFLVGHSWGIVSGLATGIDTECHEAALAKGGYTIAVLANGLDSVYPKVNESLVHRILAAGGAVVSEQPFGARAFATNLIQRDRVQSGLCVGTVVMQTDVVGGTMHTARFTLQQGRKLFVPTPCGPHRSEAKSQGNIALTEWTGIELAKAWKSENGFRDLLVNCFADRPVAWPIRSMADYDAFLQELTAASLLAEMASEGSGVPVCGGLF